LYPKKNITGEIESCLDPVHIGYLFYRWIDGNIFYAWSMCYDNDSKNRI